LANTQSGLYSRSNRKEIKVTKKEHNLLNSKNLRFVGDGQTRKIFVWLLFFSLFCDWWTLKFPFLVTAQRVSKDLAQTTHLSLFINLLSLSKFLKTLLLKATAITLSNTFLKCIW
jgi:hypothetical protein